MKLSISDIMAALRRTRRQRRAQCLGRFGLATPQHFNALVDFSAVSDPRSCRIEVAADSLVYGQLFLERDGASVAIGTGSVINPDTMIVASNAVTIGDHVWISYGCLIMDHDGHATSLEERRKDFERLIAGHPKDWTVVKSAPVVIEDDTWIGARAILLKGTRIGKGAVVSAGAVVRGTVPAFTVWGGNPARQIGLVGGGDVSGRSSKPTESHGPNIRHNDAPLATR